ncbi:MAG TPA: DUF1579 family protein [Planctomycetota bacterium]|jgi:hypothetical protein|nr:DUF1579 family protein [Planctomycetota bacterium]
MEMPKPGPGHKKLESLAGNWTGEEKMHPSPWEPKGGAATAAMTNRVACDGFWVVGDYEQRRGPAVTFRGHAVFGYDAQNDEVVLHWFDPTGMGADLFRGKFEGPRLTLTCKNAMGTHRLAYDLSEGGTLRSRMESSQDGKKWTPVFDGVYHKSGTKP